jgi:putative flippase GtrA
MQARVRQLIAWTQTHEGRKLIRFTSVSVISTIVSQALILVFYGLTGWMGVVAATVVANCLATIPAYNLNRRWTWGKSGKSHLMKEVVPFWAMSCLGIAGSYFMSLLAKHIVNGTYFVPLVNGHLQHHHHVIATLIVMAANFLAFAIFWVLKLLVFNRIFRVPSELEEVEEHLVLEEQVDEQLAHGGDRLSP